MIRGGVPVRQHRTNAEIILRCGKEQNECVGDAFYFANARSIEKVSRETTSCDDQVPGEA
jgi:hypothetical protein